MDSHAERVIYQVFTALSTSTEEQSSGWALDNPVTCLPVAISNCEFLKQYFFIDYLSLLFFLPSY